jgi:hypothetical protein
MEILTRGTRQTKIKKLNSVPGKKNIGGFEIPVDDALMMKGCEGFEDLALDVGNLGRGDCAPGDAIRQRLAIEKLKDQEKIIAGFQDVENLTDSGVADAREGTSFTPQAATRVWIRGRLVKGLDRHGTTEAFIPALVDHTHPARADLSADLVVADFF